MIYLQEQIQDLIKTELEAGESRLVGSIRVEPSMALYWYIERPGGRMDLVPVDDRPQWDQWLPVVGSVAV